MTVIKKVTLKSVGSAKTGTLQKGPKDAPALKKVPMKTKLLGKGPKSDACYTKYDTQLGH